MQLLVFLAIFGLVISFSATSQAGWAGDGQALATTANAHSSLLHLVKKKHQENQKSQKMKNKKNKHDEDSSDTSTENTQPSSKENSAADRCWWSAGRNAQGHALAALL